MAQLLVRMTRPDLGSRQAERVHVHHGIGCSDLLPGHVPGIVMRPDFALFLIGETDENVSMRARFDLHRLIQRREQRRSAPVVDNSISCRNVIEVCAHNDHLARAARQHADDVRLRRSLNRLFGNVSLIAAGVGKHSLEGGFPLRIVTAVLLQAGFNDFSGHKLVADGVFGTRRGKRPRQRDCQQQRQATTTYTTNHVSRPQSPPFYCGWFPAISLRLLQDPARRSLRPAPTAIPPDRSPPSLSWSTRHAPTACSPPAPPTLPWSPSAGYRRRAHCRW